MKLSGRLARFMDQTMVDPRGAERELIDDLEAAGGPLVEPIPGTGNVLVTFACVHDGDSVSLRSPLASVAENLNPDLDIELRRVPGTRVWHTSLVVDRRVSTSYQFRVPGKVPGKDLETEYSLLADPVGLAAFARGMLPRGFADPVNPDRLFPVYGVLGGLSPKSTPMELWDSILTLPGAEPFPHLGFSPRRGSVSEHSFASSAIPGARTVAVYLPADYDARDRYPIVLAMDGEQYRAIGRLPEILDHAIASGRIPPVIVVFWHNRDITSRVVELTCSPALLSVITDELWPWLDANYSVSSAAADRIITGFSLGGLACAWIGLKRPDIFGGVLAVSPSLWFAPDAGAGTPEPGWLIREYAGSAGRLPRMALSIGTLETESLDGVDTPRSMVELAREFRDVAQARDGEVHFREEPAGHDYLNVRRSTVSGLAVLLGGTS